MDPIGPSINPSLNLTFFTEGNPAWFIDSDSNARSGAIGDNGTSVLRTAAVGPGILSFLYRTSSEASYDKFLFVCDGTTVLERSGESAWAQFTRSVGEGKHEFLFKYVKDGSVASGQDCVWVKDVVWTPAGGEV